VPVLVAVGRGTLCRSGIGSGDRIAAPGRCAALAAAIRSKLGATRVNLTVVAHAGLLGPSAGAKAQFSERRDLEFASAEVTVVQVLQKVGIDRGSVGVMLVKGEPAGDEDTLANGAQLDLYPFFGGG
jgi:hypothetical protein